MVVPRPATFNLSFFPLPMVSINGPTTFCTGSSVELSVVGSFANIVWSNGATSPNITVSQPGNYSVQVTDANGCTATAVQTLSVGTSLFPQIATTNLNCTSSATLNAGAGYASYLWSNGATTPTINVSQAGSYMVTVSDASGCSGQASLIISFPDPPQVQILGPSSTCENTSILLSLSGSFSMVNWSTGSTGSNINVSQPGSYTVTVTDVNGCTATAVQVLAVNPVPTPNVTATNLGCNGTGTLSTGAGFESYLWSNGATTSTINISQSGNYSLTVTNSSGCTGSTSLAINLPTPPQAGIIGPAQLCEGYSETLSAPANFISYLWSTGAVSPEITITSGGQYSLTVTDGNGCSATSNWSVIELPTQYSFLESHTCSLADTGTVITNLTSQTGCDSIVTLSTLLDPMLTSSLNLTACPGEAANFNGTQILVGSSQNFVFTSPLGCDSILTVTVATLPAVALDWEAAPSCWNNNNGSVTVSTSAGIPPFRFAMAGGTPQLSPVFTGLSSGNYQMEVFDQNECSVEVSVEVAAIPRTTILLEDAALHCGEGTVVLKPEILSGDAERVAWRWSDGSETKDLQVSATGMFTLTADDGCEVQDLTATVLPAADWDRGYFYVPSSFSPNGDGLNDFFIPFQNPSIEVRSFEFRVFDRWGNSMYFTNDPTALGWDGLHRITDMQNAVFGWFLKAIVGDCEGEDMDVFEKGGVTLMR